MSTDPRIEKPDDDQEEARPVEDEKRSGEESSERDDQPQPAFQRVADEIGRRFRKALDRLA